MVLEKALAVVGQMVADGVIERYAVGGAVGAAFYLEPAETEDLDLFVPVRPTPGSALVGLPPGVYTYLLARGARPIGAHVEVAGTPIQFLPDDRLVAEGMAAPTVFQVGALAVPVLPAEHLAALALRTGRAKDHLRLSQFLRWDGFDHERFLELVARHQLADLWDHFRVRVGEGDDRD